MIKDIIEAITQIANHKRIMEHLEPNIFEHQDIKDWQTKRVLYAFALFNEEYNRGKTRNG